MSLDEHLVRRVMNEHGLTREEAIGLLKYAREESSQGGRFKHVVRPKGEEEDPAIDILALAGLLVTGLIGIATVIDAYLRWKRGRRVRKEEIKEWIV